MDGRRHERHLVAPQIGDRPSLGIDCETIERDEVGGRSASGAAPWRSSRMAGVRQCRRSLRW
jgi:hypothetical protein